MLAWEEAIIDECLGSIKSYREGFRHGWLDAFLGYRSCTILGSKWAYYTTGYADGLASWHERNSVKIEGEIVCLKSLLA